MRALAVPLAALFLASLACSGKLGNARDRTCEAACKEAEVHCEAKCPAVGDAMCNSACGKAQDACVAKCEK